MLSLDVEAFCSPRAFVDVAPVWRAAWSRLTERTPFLSHEWHANWWTHLGEGTPEIVVVRDGGEAPAVAPFVRRADGTLTLSGGDLTDVLDLIAPAGSALGPIAAYLAERASAIELRYLPTGGTAHRLLPALLREAGFDVELASLVVSPRLALPSSFDEYLASLSKKDRHELRRKMRRLESAGTVEFAFASTHFEEALDRFVAWHRQAPGEKGAFLTPEIERYFRGIARAGAEAGWLRLGELSLGGDPIAVLFALEQDGVLHAYNTAVDPRAFALSPGVLLHAHAIRDGIGRGLRVYDFLRGDEPYKYDLGGQDLVLWRLSARKPA